MLEFASEREKWGERRESYQMIWEYVGHQGYHLRDFTKLTSYMYSYKPEWESCMQCREQLTNLQIKPSYLPVSDDDFLNFVSSLSFSSTTLPLQVNTTLSHPSHSLYGMRISEQQRLNQPNIDCHSLLDSDSNGFGYPTSGTGSDHKNDSLQFQNRPKTCAAGSW